MQVSGDEGGENPMAGMFAGLTQCDPQDYGMVGNACVVFYTVRSI